MNFWTPHIDNDDLLERGRFLLAWRLSIVTSILLILLLINFSDSFLHLSAYLASFLLTFSCVILLYYTRKSRLVFILSSITGTVIVSFNLLYLSELYQAANIVWKIYIISFTFFGLGKKWGMGILLLNVISLVYYSLFVVNENLELLQPLNFQQQISLAVELTIISFLVSYIFYEFIRINDKTFSLLSKANEELRNRNELIETQNEEKTTLVKEIHHRVKNNLQIIVSLLRLQKGELNNDEMEEQFSQAINRVMVMSLIHEKLYQDNEIAKVNIANYLKDLVEDIKSLSGVGDKTSVQIHSEIDKIGLKTIVPLGLLINELVSNSLKHAFLNVQKPNIEIKIIESDNDFFKLIYFDNGNWKEKETGTTSFGIELIKILSEQMDGSYTRMSNTDGTTYSFVLNNIDVEK